MLNALDVETESGNSSGRLLLYNSEILTIVGESTKLHKSNRKSLLIGGTVDVVTEYWIKRIVI